jgi:hypothetical protein
VSECTGRGHDDDLKAVYTCSYTAMHEVASRVYIDGAMQ